MSSLFAFPGQGAQKPGMLQRLPQEPEVLECLAQASAVLGEDARLLDSAEALQSTRAVQLCLLIAGVAGARLLMRDGQRPDYVAGLSIGAYAAAVVAGALDYRDAVRLVSLRGELMQQAYPHGYGMTAILGLSLSTVEGLLAVGQAHQGPSARLGRRHPHRPVALLHRRRGDRRAEGPGRYRPVLRHRPARRRHAA